MQRLGRYEILCELGRGAMGTVYQARDPRIDRVVAIKTISIQSSEGSERDYRQRFFREAQAAGKLAHPGIVTIYDVGEDESGHTPFIVMEYIAGKTLEEKMRSAGQRLPLTTSLELIRQVAEALDYAHAQGIVHRDIKPANIIITEDDRAKITDFGIAKLTLTDYTMPGQVLGTPSYMSPEQLSGETVTGSSDLFSLGVILYSMLAGDRPFTADTVTALTFQVVYKDPTPITQQNPGLGPEFDYVISRALAKKPADRYQRGQEMAGDLEDLGKGRGPRSMAAAHSIAAMDRTPTRTATSAAVAARPAKEPSAALATTSSEKPTMVRGSTSLTAARTPQPVLPLWQRALSRELWRQKRVRIAAVAAVIVLLLAAGAIHRARQGNRGGAFATSYLRFTCFHDFRSADFTVWVDDRVILVGKLSGRRREYVQSVRTTAGKHTVRVRVVSPDDNYDQMSKISGNLPGGGERGLRVLSYHNRVMTLEWN